MTVRKKSKRKAEFGDFQTPIELARDVCSVLLQHGMEPVSILEPTCGKGSFILAALELLPTVRNIAGIDINSEHIEVACSSVEKSAPAGVSTRIVSEDFFAVNWHDVLGSLPDPLLVIGNPPWITNAELGRIGGCNLPDKSNFQNHRGIDAITGNSNFDISEWMLNKAIEWLSGREAMLAMLCKTAVARKVLRCAWKSGQHLKKSKLFHIDTARYFGAAVDACLLIVTASASNGNFDCQVYGSLKAACPTVTFGYRQGRLVADITRFENCRHFEGKERYKWRSGIKHDCAKVMEFRKEIAGYRNGCGELVDLEDDYLYPMFKSSGIANGCDQRATRWMLVPQRIVGENTRQIRQSAPKTWQYLQTHAQLLDRRASSVYRDRPRFSVFGVGDYSFAPWKVGISGFYKKLDFNVVSPYGKKPVVLDDTCYFLACKTREEAVFIAELLNSDIAKDFFSAFVFWDEKRPITVRLLKRLDLLVLARELGMEETMQGFLDQYPRNYDQPLLFSGSSFSS
ncbi:MAG: SAM-dependent DNA methyltransferase [Phycisphaerae bacterium]|nr:SAM-dependent DNA methyltransferase [Phycisphaerae bacterium]